MTVVKKVTGGKTAHNGLDVEEMAFKRAFKRRRIALGVARVEVGLLVRCGSGRPIRAPHMMSSLSCRIIMMATASG